MKLQEDDLEFHFTDAISVAKFDDNSHALSHCMKAVDFIIELSDAILFVEVKDPSNPRSFAGNRVEFQEKTNDGRLKKDLVMKYRDTFIYRWAEEKLDKPIHFLSLITLEEALLTPFQEALQRDLPLSKPIRWSKPITTSCHALTVESWNRNFPKWPVRRISASAGA